MANPMRSSQGHVRLGLGVDSRFSLLLISLSGQPSFPNVMDTLVFAYYCSGHGQFSQISPEFHSYSTGYGHATRVSAFARHLLSLRLNRRLTIHIVSSAPRHVFADSIACGALYRHADIDPVIVQPLAQVFADLPCHPISHTCL